MNKGVIVYYMTKLIIRRYLDYIFTTIYQIFEQYYQLLWFYSIANQVIVVSLLSKTIQHLLLSINQEIS